MRYSSILSDEEAVRLWLRDYSGELLSVGIRLGLTPRQQIALEDQLVSIRQSFDAMTASKTNFRSDRFHSQLRIDPMKLRWLNEGKLGPGEQGEGA